jgi:nucleoid-associated protein YgaU
MHTVVEGDYLIKIASDLCGDPTKWKDIYDANQAVIGRDPDLIFPGQNLVIPCASSPAP